MGRITSQGGQTHTMAEEISNNATIVDEMEPEEESLVLGDDDPRDAALHEHILSEECAWHGRIIDVNRLEVTHSHSERIRTLRMSLFQVLTSFHSSSH